MGRRIGVYGFNFTKKIHNQWFEITPKYTNRSDANNNATDKKALKLTGYGEIVAAIDSQRLFDLEGALTFIQQQLVMIDLRDRQPEDYPEFIPIIQNRGTLGRLIMEDNIKPDSTRVLLHILLEKLFDDEFCKKTGFRNALFRNIAIHKLFRPEMDLTYYLSFSGLELVARHMENDFNTSVAQVLSPYLTKLGFQTSQQEMQIFADLRNVLFHNGKYEKEIDVNGVKTVYKLTDYDTKLERLLCCVLLKLAKFDDGTINWDRWQDRQPFKG